MIERVHFLFEVIIYECFLNSLAMIHCQSKCIAGDQNNNTSNHLTDLTMD